MEAWKIATTGVATMGLLVAGAALSNDPGTLGEPATNERGGLQDGNVYSASKPQADRRGLFVDEWTPTFFVEENQRVEFEIGQVQNGPTTSVIQW